VNDDGLVTITGLRETDALDALSHGAIIVLAIEVRLAGLRDLRLFLRYAV